LAVSSTIYETKTVNSNSNSGTDQPILNPWIKAFSLKSNLDRLLSTKESPGEIKSANGIRAISTLLLFLGHHGMLMSVLHYTNKNDLVKHAEEPLSLVTSNVILFNNSFFILSGMLTANSIFKSLNKTGKVQVFREYFGRYLR
jgi:hypothetical protein